MAKVVGLCVALGAVGCAHTGETVHVNGAASAYAAHSEVDALKSQLEERDQRIRQLENRLSLIEAEQRQHRMTLEDVRDDAEAAHSARKQDDERDAALSEHFDDKAARRKKAAEPRPVLRLYEEGAPEVSMGGEASPVPSTTSRARDGQPLMPIPQVEERLPRFVPEAGASANGAPMGAPEHYRQALDLVRQRNFDAALISLNDFLVRYEHDVRAPKVLFWRGEVLFAQRDYARALAAFETSLVKDPGGEKAADAWLRIARCHKRLGDKEAQKAALERVKSQYPGSEAARLAAQEVE